MYSPSYTWAKVLMYLESRLSEVTVSAWMDDAEVIELTEERLVIYSPSDFRQQIIRDRCAPYITEALLEILQRKVKLEVWGDSELRAYRDLQKKEAVYSNPLFTFENYIAGSSNELAAKVARAAAEEPGRELYNPLFLYGPPGVGKTHLLYAVVDLAMKLHPDKNIVYLRADSFTNELISAILNGTTAEFKKKYRRADIFLMDDIQFIAGKEATQEEFFHCFNELYEHGKQIIITADRPPLEMATLEDRLRSRFGSGILVGITPPEEETRYRIAVQKAAQYKLPLSEAVLRHIAQSVTENVRLVEGELKKLRAVHELTGMALTLENVQKLLEDIRSERSNQPITPDFILRNVSKYYGVDTELLKSPQRSRGISEPRQIAMYLMRSILSLGFEEIGRIFNRDHGTVLRSVKKVDDTLKQKGNKLDPILKDIRSNIENAPY